MAMSSEVVRGVSIGEIAKAVMAGATPEAVDPAGHALGRATAELVQVTRQLVAVQAEAIQRLEKSNEDLRLELAAKSGREVQRWVTVARAAEMLGVTEKTVRNRIQRKELMGRKVGDKPQSRLEVDVQSIERQSGAGH